MSRGVQRWVDEVWYGDSRAYLPLLPLTLAYAGATALRRRLYEQSRLPIHRADVPVIVVGNLTAGGTGKTPVVIWLADALRQRGFAVGVVSRGYRGRVGREPVIATPESDPAIVGDEPVLIARRTGCPVAVHPDRAGAVARLAGQGVDIVIADDGLQHYRLHRDAEIVVVDGARCWGNGRLLPAGPLREPLGRLGRVDRLLVQGRPGDCPAVPPGLPTAAFRLEIEHAVRLVDGERRPLDRFREHRVHAAAAIGNPARFFDALAARGIDVIRHPLPDHAAISERDLDFGDARPVLITEKDAVKCAGTASERLWYVPAELVLVDGAEANWLDDLVTLVESRRKRLP